MKTHKRREKCSPWSGDEMALCEELDDMTEALERSEEVHMSWELVAAKKINQVRACMCMCVCERECV